MPARRADNADFLVLGSGIAGMRAAIELASQGRVLVLSKGDLCDSNTLHAQGGIAAALGDDDEVSLHLHDTLTAGDGLCREEAVRILVGEGPKQIQQLMDWGTRFDCDGTKLAFAREGAHSRSRVLHAHGDSTGSEILRTLVVKARSLPAIEIRPHAFAADLLVQDQRVCGVRYIDEKTSTVRETFAGAVLLATGGLGQVYKETTNPPMACGDGVAMAYRAGAVLSDMEFVQFHPTGLYVKGAPRFLLSEALRGEGAHLRNILLERFMPRYHEAAELAPRDAVSRAIVMEMQRTRSDFVYLDLTGLDAERVKKRFPKIYSTCLEYNVDLTTDLVPTRPAAHYAIGGVFTDFQGATTLQGLFAAGEVAATGVHGANRLASNSLLEGLVFGARTAWAMLKQRSNHLWRQACSKEAPANSASEDSSAKADPAPADLGRIANMIRFQMWEKAGVIRHGRDLANAVRCLESLPLPCAPTLSRHHAETHNLFQVALLIARCALERKESRGTHYRADFPLKNDAAPAQHSFVSKDSPVRFAPD